MKKTIFFALMIAVVAGSAFRAAEFTSVSCGIFAFGNAKLDLTGGKTTMEVSKAALVENIKKGLTYSGSSACPGTYEIVNVHLTIDGAKEAKYEFNYDLVGKMSAMEDPTLVRYFNNAQKLTFSQIKVKNSKGEISYVPTITFTVKP